MVFGPVVGAVVGTGAPVVSVLSLGVTTTQPVKTHVHGFRALWLDVVVDYSQGGAVVGLDRGLGLFVAHFFE
jgi:hypothetical protein